MNFTIERPSFKDAVYNILDFGAKSSIDFNNQTAIQQAINTCSRNGGGMVLVPDGYYYTGPIVIKSNVNFHVSENAYIQFSKSKEEYPLIFTEYEGIRRIRAISPISSTNTENIAITGKGIIDGAGHLWRGIKKMKLTDKEWQRCLKISPYVINTKETQIWCPTKTYYDGVIKGEPDYTLPNALELAAENYDVYRPVMVSLVNCNKVLIEDVTLQNSPAWNVHPLYCKNFTMLGAKIKNKSSAQNGDGIDLESCQNCEIAHSTFDVGDDGICIKSGKNKEARKTKIPTKNVWIHDCKVFEGHGGFVVGSEMSRGVSNIIVENCIFNGTDIGVRFKSALGRGGVVENITIRNIQMARILGEAVIFTMGYVLSNIEDPNEGLVTYEEDDIPEFRNIHLENINCVGAKIGIKLNGLKERPIHNITFKNIDIQSDKDMDLLFCEDVKLDNVTIKSDGNEKTYNETFKA